MESPHGNHLKSSKSRRLKVHGLRVRVDCPHPAPQHVPYEPRRPLLQRQRGAVWKCQACQGHIDNPFFAIGCDHCKGWYHIKCVSISTDPSVSQDWHYCLSCEDLISACNSFKRQTNLQSYIEKRGDKTSPRETGKCTSNLNRSA